MRSKEEFQWAAHAKLLSSSVGQNIAFSSGPSSSTTGRLLLDLKQHQNKMSLWGIRDSRNRVVQVQHDSQDGKWINFICFKQTGSAEDLNKENPRQTCTTRYMQHGLKWKTASFLHGAAHKQTTPQTQILKSRKNTCISIWPSMTRNSFEIKLQHFTPHQLMQNKMQSGHRLKIFDWVISVLGTRQAKPVVKWVNMVFFSFWSSNLRQPHPKCARGCIGGSRSSWLSFPSFLPIFQFLPAFPFLHDFSFLYCTFFDRPPAIISW